MILNVKKCIRSFPLVGKNEIDALVNTLSDPASKIDKNNHHSEGHSIRNEKCYVECESAKKVNNSLIVSR
jgi:hypothetical protein